MDEIKNIIFDLGGVIYDINYENIANTFTHYGVNGTEHFYGRTFQTPEMDLFEMGKMSVPDFHNYIRRMSGIPLKDAEIDEIINAILIDIPQKRVRLLQNLKKKYGIFLFSNTNQINYDCYTQAMQKKYGFDVFHDCFDACYFSHIMHLRKPSLEGFFQILNEQHITGASTLFIDDNKANVDAARLSGLHSYQLIDKDITDLFDENLSIKTDILY